ncbi:type I secretion system permease/ATPase [Oricola cellulosilytica]|nr:type I secretion system permease/ATPase [Oricola cellulosilytica]
MTPSPNAKMRRAFVEIGVFSFFTNILLLVMPLYMLQVYDRVLPSSSLDTLAFITILAVGALGLLAVLEVVRGIYANRIAATLDIAHSRQALQAAMESSRASLGDIQSMRDLSTVRAFIGSRSVFVLFDLPFAPLFIALLWLVHPLLFGITTGGAVLLATIAFLNQKATASDIKSASERAIAEMITAQSFTRNAETLRAMGMMDNALKAWATHHVASLAANDSIARTNSLFTGLSRFVRMGLQIGVLGVGGWLVLRGEMTAGMIFASSIIAGRGLQPIDQITGSWRQITDVRGSWRRFSDTAGTLPKPRNYTELPPPEGRLDLENLVYFAPNATSGSEPVLKRVTVHVPAASVIGIVGPSGAGKSTLARLMVGAVRPSAGVVRIDGADIRNWDPNLLGRHIGYLPQEVEILPGTIAQNIARFNPAADGAAILEAARRAHVHDLIQSMPAGYDTVIGPAGVTLSGGQRQRIGLARAFYGDPRILVLDEPNSNLDDAGDAALNKAVEEARKNGTTVLLITQRTLPAQMLDSLLVLNDGKLDDFGPHEEVLERQQRKLAGQSGPRIIAGRGNEEGANRSVPEPSSSAISPRKKSPFASYGPGLRPLKRGNDTE